MQTDITQTDITTEEIYEVPALVEIGDFNELTTWYGWASNDSEGEAII